MAATRVTKKQAISYLNILETYENKDIQQYISNTRKEGKSDDYFIKFEQMEKKFQQLNEPVKK